MFELIKVLFVIVSMFCVYAVMMYAIARKYYHFPADKAEKQIKDLLVTGFGLFKESIPEPNVTDVLTDKCFKILQKNFSVSRDICNCDVCCNYGFNALTFDIVTTYIDSVFQLAKIQLEKCVRNHFSSLEYTPTVYVYFEEHAPNEFYFFICYACTENCKTSLSNFIKNRNAVARNNAIARENPVIDDALEKELKLFE